MNFNDCEEYDEYKLEELEQNFFNDFYIWSILLEDLRLYSHHVVNIYKQYKIVINNFLSKNIDIIKEIIEYIDNADDNIYDMVKENYEQNKDDEDVDFDEFINSREATKEFQFRDEHDLLVKLKEAEDDIYEIKEILEEFFKK